MAFTRKGKRRKGKRRKGFARRSPAFARTVLFVGDDESAEVTRIVASIVGAEGHATLWRNRRHGHDPDLYREVVYIGAEPDMIDDHLHYFDYVPYYEYALDLEDALELSAYHHWAAQEVAAQVLKRLK